MSETLVVSLVGNANVFSPVCGLEIGVEDVDTSAVQICLMKTLVNSPNQVLVLHVLR